MATYLVTGANRGIGLEYCRQLTARGDRAIAVCRQGDPALDQLGIQVETGVDLTDDRAIQGLVERLGDTPLDVVIHNGAIYGAMALETLDWEALIQMFAVNSVGPLRLTKALLPLLPRGSKIAIMTSRMGSIADNTSGGSYDYRMSKVALSMAGKSLAIDLEPRGIAVAILHPGLVQTRMTNFTPAGITPETAVKGLLARIDALTLDRTGRFWHSNGEILPW